MIEFSHHIYTNTHIYIYVYVAVNIIQSDHHHSLDVDQARLLERGKTSGRADDNLVLSSAVALLSSYEDCKKWWIIGGSHSKTHGFSMLSHGPVRLGVPAVPP